MHFTPLPYLDPGSGSFLLQLLIAALLGLGVAIRASWGRIKGWFGIHFAVLPRTDNHQVSVHCCS